MTESAELKKRRVADEGGFVEIVEENFASYYQVLAPWVNRLRKAIFPNGGRWKTQSKPLNGQVKEIPRAVQRDQQILAV
jgi:hypothetical protein